METLELVAGDARLTLLPATGGGIGSWTLAGTGLLHARRDEVLATKYARGLAAYPLVPYSNRIAHGRFTWDGAAYQLPTLWEGHAIHGVGWQRSWSVLDFSTTSAVLRLEFPGGPTWPFAFEAEQSFVLTETTLDVTMTVVNRHPSPAPAGLGLHPYFPRGTGCTLQFAAAGVWRSGPDMIPVARTAIPPAWDHSGGGEVGSAVLDNCFDGWDGTVRLHWPARGLTLTIAASEAFQRLVVFTPEGKDFLAVEPATNMNDGLNHMDEAGMDMLEPGHSLSGRIVLTLS